MPQKLQESSRAERLVGPSSRKGRFGAFRILEGARSSLGGKMQIAKDCYEGAAHSMRKACTGSMEAARRAGMMPAMAAASTSTPMAIAMTGTFTLVIS